MLEGFWHSKQFNFKALVQHRAKLSKLVDYFISTTLPPLPNDCKNQLKHAIFAYYWCHCHCFSGVSVLNIGEAVIVLGFSFSATSSRAAAAWTCSQLNHPSLRQHLVHMTELLEHVLVLGVSLLIPGSPLRHVLDHHGNDWFPATDSLKYQ